jgi:uncharacterized protein
MIPIQSRMTPPAFHLLAKPTGAICNLACEYCFYLDKELLYPGSPFRMLDTVLKAYIQQLLAAQRAPEINIAWQGGEPMLMGLDFYEYSIELVRKYKKPSQNVFYSLQTNGTLIDDKWCTFFKKHDFLIGLSMDGPREMHNTYRVDKGGHGSFEQVRRGWDLLQKHQVETNILCAVHAANASHPVEVYRFFRDDLHARFLQFIPIVIQKPPGTSLLTEKQGAELRSSYVALNVPGNYPVNPLSVGAGQYGHFLIDVFEEWVHHDVGTMFVQSFDSALASWCRIPASICVFQETCGLSLILEHNGDLYSCDHFVEPGHRLGNILQTPMFELVSSTQQRQFGQDKHEKLPAACCTCEVRFACQGECPRNRFLTTPTDHEEGLNYLCTGYKLFFHHVEKPMRIMADLLHRGRAPAEIIKIY